MTENTPTKRIDRRTLLRAGLTAGAATLAGCLGGDDGESPTTTPTKTATPAQTDMPTATATETPTTPTYEIPVTGEAVPELRPLDEATVKHMMELDYGAGSLSFYRDGAIELSRGYGWADRERTEPVDPEAMFRIGSISKLFTADAVLRLVDAGEVALDDEFYPLIDVDPPGGELEDERLREVTVEHLLKHGGGWDRSEHANPLFNPLVVTESLGLAGTPERDDFVQYVLGQPLQFDPGSDNVYSNIGYVMLSLVVEGVTGDSFESVVSANLFEPADATDIHLGSTRPENRHSDEIWYDDSEQCENVFAQDESESDACADYGMVVSAFSGAGGFVASAPDLARALSELQYFWINGQSYRSLDQFLEGSDRSSLPWFGSVYDSFGYAGRRSDGWVVALFNDRDRQQRRQIHTQLNEAFEAVDT
ncbi:serine hydrolase domain-containing protein [Halovenus salina]|uniref:Serine hydrolase domain-containing protein n=1 Tax=Halovenus salina TaxID=1510225 RepID=A0ABD5W6E7_9EURY|nr:serine hydrolase domain-containing protein [Halovenus salina]